MLSTQQKNCVKFVVENLPKSLKLSPVVTDVADESMRHIMGGDPLESLFLKAVRTVLTNTANFDNEIMIEYLKNTHLDNFSNCFLNNSPELMLCLFDNCQWEPSNTEKLAKITIKAGKFLLEINGHIYLDVSHDENKLVVPQWMPYLLRRFCIDGIKKIDIHIEGPPSEIENLQKCEKELYKCVQNADYSKRNNHVYPKSTTNLMYSIIKGTVCFAAHSKRKGSATVFAKLSCLQGNSERDINDIMKIDFT